YAWGTTAIVNVNTLSNDGTPTETHAHALPPGAGPKLRKRWSSGAASSGLCCKFKHKQSTGGCLLLWSDGA
ncbi:MAG: hypothetical protein ABDH66_00755, partial [Bacteroidia bacterium]